MKDKFSLYGRRDLIRWAYRIFLDREPEDEAFQNWDVADLRQLRNNFLLSEEYLQNNGPGLSLRAAAGLPPEDLALLGKHRSASLTGAGGYLTDFLGIRHSVTDLPFIAERGGEVVDALPVPDDTFHAEAIEYIALFTSLEHSGPEYTMFELGAGWGPWMCAAGVAAKRMGKKKINLIGVEGAENKMPLIRRHLQVNGLRPESDEMSTDHDGVRAEIFNGIVNCEGGWAEFPEVGLEAYGASIMPGTTLLSQNKHRRVRAYALRELMAAYPRIDFIHLDLQGYELELLEKEAARLAAQVRYLAVGTHSRRIEGLLFELLYDYGFSIIRETPCQVYWPRSAPESFINVTHTDGLQFWGNNNL